MGGRDLHFPAGVLENNSDLNYLPKTDSEGNLINSSVTDNGTLVNVAEPMQISSPQNQFKIIDSDDNKYSQFSHTAGLLNVRNNSTSANHLVLNESGWLGIGVAPTAAPLEVMGKIQAGSVAATSGAILLQAKYNNQPAHTVLTEYSSAAIGFGYLMYQNNSSTWLSALAANIARCSLLVGNTGLKFITAPVQNVAVGGALTTQPTPKFSVDISGNGTFAGNVTAPSDIRLKDNINKIENALEKVFKLSGYTWDRKDMKLSQAGLMAQEVQEVLPTAVIENEGVLSLAYNQVFGLVIEAIKELKNEINNLR